jgi:hypothetical protein
VALPAWLAVTVTVPVPVIESVPPLSVAGPVTEKVTGIARPAAGGADRVAEPGVVRRRCGQAVGKADRLRDQAVLRTMLCVAAGACGVGGVSSLVGGDGNCARAGDRRAFPRSALPGQLTVKVTGLPDPPPVALIG